MKLGSHEITYGMQMMQNKLEVCTVRTGTTPVSLALSISLIWFISLVPSIWFVVNRFTYEVFYTS